MADIDFEEVQLGTAPTGVGGDVPRTAFGKITRNFNKIKAFFSDSSNAASRKVGENDDDVMPVGAGGWLGTALYMQGQYLSEINKTCVASTQGVLDPPEGVSQNLGMPVLSVAVIPSRVAQLFLGGHPNHKNDIRFRTINSDSPEPWVSILHSGNTTTDSNGFIKAASPIIKLSNDKIEKTDHLEIENAEFERIGTGHYKLKNVPLLSRDGWYIETPKDRNNNIYFTLDYEENNGELIIKTYEPDYSSGRAENGAPVDILEGRFVSLRFAENPELYPEPEDE